MMTAKLLSNLLPLELIEIIEAYQIPNKDSAFIVRWMNTLTSRHSKDSDQIFWKFLIRDSEELIIEMPQHQLSRFNFAHFVQNFIKYNLKQRSKYFEIFCKNAIRNNPDLIFNRYYVGNGGAPCYQLISSFLFVRRILNSQIQSCQQIQDALFNIYAFIMQGDYLSFQNCYHFFYGFNYGFHGNTKYAVDVLKLFFQKYQTLFLDYDSQDTNVSDYYNIKQLITTFFRTIFKQMSQKKNNIQQIRHMRYQNCQNMDGYQIQIELRKRKIEQFLYYFQERYYTILEKYKKYLIQSSFKEIEFTSLQFLITLPEFQSLIFTEDYVFHLIKCRKFKLFTLLWSFEEKREMISKFKLDDKNILEIAAENRGLSHNFIDILWKSKLFQSLPLIVNQKSKYIIHLRYGVAFSQNE